MPLYLGVDGGQSGTTALIADESGEVIGVGRGGPCNHTGAPDRREKFFKAIRQTLAEACKDAGLDAERVSFQAACLGFSGGAADKAQYSRELIRSAKYKITHDAEIALSGATGGRPGIVVIAGTGSMAFGRNGQGETARAGGWGYLFGDEGGAFYLVREGLRAALRFEEGWGQKTALHPALCEATQSGSADELMRRFYTSEFPRETIAALAPLVDQAAEEGDEIAGAIIDQAGTELAGYARGVYEHLFRTEKPTAVSYAGGVFRSRRLLEAFRRNVRVVLDCVIEAPRFIPAVGALLEAFQLEGRVVTLRGVPESDK
jgi:N-acetylglucosamine kinase-like BadF-type ATPase